MTYVAISPHDRSDGQLVLAVQGQDQDAFAELFDRWFDRVFDVARNITRDDESAAEVAQDVFLVVWQQISSLRNPEAFGGWALRTSRNRALNRLKKEQRSRPMEAEVMTGIHDRQEGDDLVGSNRLTDTAAISEIRDRQDLLWTVTSVLGERDASLLDLTLRHQLSAAEIADELGIEVNNAHQLLYRLRNKLGDAVANFLVWRDGSPRCAKLRSVVSDLGFDATTNRKVNKHTKICETCASERAAVVDPHKLFGAVPIAIAPLILRTKAAAALSAAGIAVPATTSIARPSVDSSAPPTATAEDGPIGILQHGRRGRIVRKLLVFVGVGAVVFAVLSLFQDRSLQEVETGAPSPTVTEAPVVETSPTEPLSKTLVVPPSVRPTTSEPAASTTVASELTTTSRKPPKTSTTTPTTLAASTTIPTTSTSSTTSTITTTSTTSTTAPAVPPPTIERFIVTNPVGLILECLDHGQIGRRASWSVLDATSVNIITPTETFTQGAGGQQLFCAVPGMEIRLEATGPGGTSSATATS